MSPGPARQVVIEGPAGRTTSFVGRLFDSGGKGHLHLDQARPDYVIKLLKNPTPESERKLRAMLAFAPERQQERDPDDGSSILQIAWPQELVFDVSGNYLGFTMRKLDKNQTVELHAWFNPASRQRNGLSQSDRTRIYLAANLASVTEHLNRVGHCLVDFKPQNVLAYRQHGYVCLVDCDGFLIRAGDEWAAADGATPDYLAPEFQQNFDPSKLDETQDRFGLAVMLYMLLDNGRHPAAGKLRPGRNLPEDLAGRLREEAFFMDPASGLSAPGGSHHEYLPDETLALFRRAFLGAPTDRPSSREWRVHLFDVARNRMVRCNASTDHWHYGKGCPWCGSANLQQRAPNTTGFVHGAPEPSAAPTPPQPVPPPARTFRLFDPGAVAIASLLGPLGSSALIALNYKRLGRRGPAWASIGLGLLAYILLIFVESGISDVLLRSGVLAAGGVAFVVASKLQGPAVAGHLKHGGRIVPRWIVLVWVLVIWVLLISAVATSLNASTIIFPPPQPPPRPSPIGVPVVWPPVRRPGLDEEINRLTARLNLVVAAAVPPRAVGWAEVEAQANSALDRARNAQTRGDASRARQELAMAAHMIGKLNDLAGAATAERKTLESQIRLTGERLKSAVERSPNPAPEGWAQLQSNAERSLAAAERANSAGRLPQLDLSAANSQIDALLELARRTEADRHRVGGLIATSAATWRSLLAVAPHPRPRGWTQLQSAIEGSLERAASALSQGDVSGASQNLGLADESIRRIRELPAVSTPPADPIPAEVLSRLSQLQIRAEVVTRLLDSLRERQRALRMDLRADMASSELQMKHALRLANQAVVAGRLDPALQSLSAAEAATQKLERFLNIH